MPTLPTTPNDSPPTRDKLTPKLRVTITFEHRPDLFFSMRNLCVDPIISRR
jgi:hypothetical protein